MTRVAILGAGAECDLGLPSGHDFTFDTYYCKKTRLYEALSTFYSNRLGQSEEDSLPEKYIQSFLFNSDSLAFKRLIKNIHTENPEYISRLLGRRQIQSFESFTKNDFHILFNKIILDDAKTSEDQPQSAVNHLDTNEFHFGILEQYYSDLINPRNHPGRFWKLVNFYWSAFFSILLPIANELYRGITEYEADNYGYVLRNLDCVIKDVFSEDEIFRCSRNNCYYKIMANKFDGVITTNYTPYINYLMTDSNDSPSHIARLSGSLSQFEDVKTLAVSDSLHEQIDSQSCIFPYIMCQSPVKPIIDANQLSEYSKAIKMLNSADEIVVLGYSFCDEDSHIASIVRTALLNNQNSRLCYFSYNDKLNRLSTDSMARYIDEDTRALLKKLRLPTSFDRARVYLVKDCNSKTINELI